MLVHVFFGLAALHAGGVAAPIPRQLMWVWSECHCLAVEELVCTTMLSVLSMYIYEFSKHA